MRATGGGAHRFAERFRERLGVILRREDEMACLVTGCTFLLRAVQHEAFHFRDGECCFLSQSEGARQIAAAAITAAAATASAWRPALRAPRCDSDKRDT